MTKTLLCCNTRTNPLKIFIPTLAVRPSGLREVNRKIQKWGFGLQETVEKSSKARSYDLFLQKQLMTRQHIEKDKVALERLEKLHGFRLHVPRSEEDKMMVQVAGYCLECGADVVVDPHTFEVVCVNGHVWGFLIEKTIPMEEESVDDGHAEGSYSPEVSLNFTGKLGSQMDQLGASNLLRGNPETSNETFTSRRGGMLARVPWSHPLIKEFLTFAKDFCTKYELNQRLNSHHAWFADQLALHLGKIGEFYVNGLAKKHFDNQRISACIFCLLFRQVYPQRYNAIRRGNNGTKEKYPELFLPDELVNYFKLILQFCNPPVLPQLP